MPLSLSPTSPVEGDSWVLVTLGDVLLPKVMALPNCPLLFQDNPCLDVTS